MLNELENDEAVLLLYLAGELPAESRAEVDRRLAVEPALREELERLEAVQGAVSSWFKNADAASATVEDGRGRSPAAVRRVSRAFVERRLRQEEAAAARAAAAKGDSLWPKSLLPRWAYPVTAAAAIIVGLLSVVQWGGTLVGNDHGQGYSDMRSDDHGHFGGGSSRFAAGTFAMDEDDLTALQLSEGSYDVSTMFQPDVD